MKNSVVRNISSWSLPDLIDLPSKVIIYFLLVDLLDKKTFGMLNLAMMIFSYHALTQFGVVDWLMYELPKKFTEKRDTKPVLRDSYYFSLINQLVLFSFVFCGLLVFDHDFFLGMAIPAYMAHTLLYNAYLHKTLFLRYRYEFKKLLRLRVLFVIVRFVLEASSILLVGIYGYLVIEAIIVLLPIFLLRKDIAFSYRPSISLEKYKSLALKGAPFFVVILMSITLGNLDRWFIVYVYGLEQFAVYSLGVFVVTAILIFPGKVLSIFTQYLKEMFVTVHDRDSNIAIGFSVNNVLLVILLLVLSLGSVFESLVSQYLPKYGEVILLINALILFTAMKYSISLTSNILYLLDRRADVAKIQIVTVALYTAMLSAIYWLDYGILNAIWGINLVSLVQISINLLLIILIMKFKIHLEMFKFFILILAGFSYYFSKDFSSFEVPWSSYIMLLVLVYAYKYKCAWKNLVYLSTKAFELK